MEFSTDEGFIMNKIYLSETYKSIYSLPIGVKAINSKLNVGPVRISINSQEDIYTGRLNENGVISGLSHLFRDKNLESGMVFTYQNNAIDSILLYLNDDQNLNEITGNPVADSPSKKLKWPHNEICHPDNFKYWHPSNEFDVCFAFGLLHQITNYSYCCALNNKLISKIEYFERVSTSKIKPDAILHDKHSNEYLIAKFALNSSDYKKHHTPDDVDVLIVWRDDEKKRSLLPMQVVELYRLAKEASTKAVDAYN